MKKIDEVIKQIEQITLQDGNQYHIEIRELIISKIEQYRNELLNELEKEFENHYWDSVQKDKEMILSHIKQKFAEMREGK